MSLTARVSKLEGRCPDNPYAHLSDEELEAQIDSILEGYLRRAGVWGDPGLWPGLVLPQLPPDVREGMRENLKRLEDKIMASASLADLGGANG
jgi:hypothetical protein